MGSASRTSDPEHAVLNYRCRLTTCLYVADHQRVYNSTKYALESLSDALRYELRPFGVDVALIEPGVIRTQFESTAVANLEAARHGAYAAAVGKYEEISKLADRFASEPIVIAKAIARAVRARRAAARYVAPRSGNILLAFRAVAPTPVWDWAMRKLGYLSASTLDVSRPAAALATNDRQTQPKVRVAAN